jgi:hypothetical protein
MNLHSRSKGISRENEKMGSHITPRAGEDKEIPSDPVEYDLFRYVRLRHGDNASHPLDWDRFYRFVVRAHIRRKGWDAYDVKARMLRYGLVEGKATEMAEIYWHCRCAMRVRSHWTRRIGYADWMHKGALRTLEFTGGAYVAAHVCDPRHRLAIRSRDGLMQVVQGSG